MTSLENRNKMETFTATVNMPSRNMAKELGKLWTRKTFVGHDISSVQNNGSVNVILYKVTESEKQWVEQTAQTIGANA